MIKKKGGSVTNAAHQSCTVNPAGADSIWSVQYAFQSGHLAQTGEYDCDLRLTIGGKTETHYGLVKIMTRARVG